MRIRHSLAAVVLGGALAFGALAAPAQAATAGRDSESVVAKWQWVYGGTYPNYETCTADAAAIKVWYNIKTRCTYYEPTWHLELWLDR